jgi:broad specificity phosphatase PhoE
LQPDLILFIVQHCQSEHHVNDLTGGWTDTPLTRLGREQAALVSRALKTKLEAKSPTLYSSDLLRASQTAEALASELGLAMHIDRDLRERNNGSGAWKTKAWAEENAAPLSPPGEGVERREFEGAETPREFFERVTACAERLIAGMSDPLVLVTHGGTVGTLIAWWLGMTVEQYDRASFIAVAGSITTLGIDYWQRRTLVELNATAHLDKAST